MFLDEIDALAPQYRSSSQNPVYRQEISIPLSTDGDLADVTTELDDYRAADYVDCCGRPRSSRCGVALTLPM